MQDKYSYTNQTVLGSVTMLTFKPYLGMPNQPFTLSHLKLGKYGVPKQIMDLLDTCQHSRLIFHRK